MGELKPCPKCGSTEVVGRVCGGDAAYGCGEYEYEVECKCGILFNTSHTSETAEEAEKLGIAEWNTRAERTCSMTKVDDEAVELWPCYKWQCSVCGGGTECGTEDESCLDYCPDCGAKVIKEKENKMTQPNIDKPIAESLETICVKESQPVSECIACIMNALDDLAPLIADDEHITAEVNKDSVAVSVFKGRSFVKTSAALMGRKKDSDEWETTVCDSLLAMVFEMSDRCCGDGNREDV